MAYTCAYYPGAATTLDEAQDAKMHHVCRKLRLRPGERVVEAGFGWGRLAVHMARHYGVKVRAFNISKEQVSFARDYAKSQGLESQIEYVEDDYRNISGSFDAFVSVGMLEHVGVENYRAAGQGRARRAGRQRPRPDPYDRPQLPGAAASVDRAADFPGRLPAGPERDDRRSSSPGICRCWTWKTCGCTTRAP